MSYVIVVSLLLSLAALALEHSARIRQKPTRWLWGASTTASLLVPLIVSSVSVPIPQLGGVADPPIPQRIVAVRDITVNGLSPSGWLAATAGSLPASPDLDRLLQVGWSAAARHRERVDRDEAIISDVRARATYQAAGDELGLSSSLVPGLRVQA
jgi:hypothetical protein